MVPPWIVDPSRMDWASRGTEAEGEGLQACVGFCLGPKQAGTPIAMGPNNVCIVMMIQRFSGSTPREGLAAGSRAGLEVSKLVDSPPVQLSGGPNMKRFGA